MRINEVLASALYTSAALLGSVRAADDIDDGAEASSTSLSETLTSVPIEKPTFTVGIPISPNPLNSADVTIDRKSLC